MDWATTRHRSTSRRRKPTAMQRFQLEQRQLYVNECAMHMRHREVAMDHVMHMFGLVIGMVCTTDNEFIWKQAYLADLSQLILAECGQIFK